MNICFETFGCRLNRAEALDDEAKCLAAGHRVVTSHSEADIIVVRGCSVTSRAQRDCEKVIDHLKRKYPAKRILLTGCISGAKKFEVPATHRDSGGVAKDSPEPVAKRTARAYLKVQDGCSCGCTFCIVPKFRGKPASVPFGDVVDKARRFIDAGYHEIVVTGCNLMLYSSEGHGLADLTSTLAGLSPQCRVRLGSVEPGAQAHELLHAMAENENICRFLHLSVQSGSNMILKAMRRPYCVKDVDAIAIEAAKLLPMACLGCDLIAGFPGETDIDFMLTKGLLARHRFANVHAFPYSERPGTLAAAMMAKIPPEIRKIRAKTLGDLGLEAKRNFAKRFVGRTVDVVVESSKTISGWTGEYLWLEASHLPPTLETRMRAGYSQKRELLKFRVGSAHNGALRGELI